MAGIPLNQVIGDRELCAWQPVPGITWVQTRDSKHAHRMARRTDAKLVVVGVAGGYLKTFEFARPMSWAVRLLARYTGNEAVTNVRLNHAAGPQAHPDLKGLTFGRMDTLERARRYLARLPVAVSGQGGHRVTFRAACALVQGFALAETDALSLLQEWNSGCQPPWSENDLRHKVASAMASTGKRVRGHLVKGGQKTSSNFGARATRVIVSTNVEREKPRFREGTLKRIAALVTGVDE